MKVGIVGTGLVGATAAYALIMRGLGSEIVLVDVNVRRAQAEADDLLHAVPFVHPLEVRAGGYEDLAGCRAIVVTAGTAQKPGESRLQLMGRNAGIVRSAMEGIFKYAPEATIVMVSNPVDIMTHVAVAYANKQGFPAQRIFGSGTTLDTARFRSLLGRYLGVDAQHIHGYVVGEHGDSELLTWSLAAVGGIPLETFVNNCDIVWGEEKRREMETEICRAAYQIIEGKGATYYGIGAAISRILDVVLHDHRAILTVCAPHEEVLGVKNVTLSLPYLVGAQGVLDTLPLDLNAAETEALRSSATVIRKAIDELEAGE